MTGLKTGDELGLQVSDSTFHGPLLFPSSCSRSWPPTDSQLFLQQNGFVWEQKRIAIHGDAHASPERQRLGLGGAVEKEEPIGGDEIRSIVTFHWLKLWQSPIGPAVTRRGGVLSSSSCGGIIVSLPVRDARCLSPCWGQ